jgi:DNA-binding protein HU-beta
MSKLIKTIVVLMLSVSTTAIAGTNPAVVVTLAKQAGISEEEARIRFEQSIAAITAELSAGRDVTITNFGKFYLSEREARTGRNPKTGAAIAIPAKRYPKFSSAERLKDSLNPEISSQQLAGDQIVAADTTQEVASVPASK